MRASPIRQASIASVALGTAWLVLSPAAAQDFHHPAPWVAEASLVCVPTPTTMTRAELDRNVASARAGSPSPPALELIASCAIPRRDVAEAFVAGGLVRHRAGDFQASSAAFAQAVVADPSHLAARFDYACALARLGNRSAAISELGELARAGEPARRWLARVGTDADLESVRDDEDVRAFALGGSSLWDPPPVPAPGIPVPSATGAVWEPIDLRDWAPFRALLVASGRFGDRRGFRPAEPAAFGHPSLEGLERIVQPAFWRPERGRVFLVVPFSIPGPNHRDGLLVLHWNGAEYELSCHEYCQFLSETGTHELRVRVTDDRIRVVRCRGAATRCSAFEIQASGRVARHRSGSLLDGVVPSSGTEPDPG